MKIANGVEMLELTADVLSKQRTVYPTLIWDKDAVVLVDTGYPNQLSQIREAMEKASIPFEKLNTIIITHHDADHIGSLSSIAKELPGGVEVIAHKEEKPYIEGERCPIKLAQMEARLDVLPDEMRKMYEDYKANLGKLRATIDKTVADGEVLPVCGGITIIHTPGHTPGHISLYLKRNKLLIAGDMLFSVDGMLNPAPHFTNDDQCLAMQSLKKMTQYDIERIICYHGGMYDRNVKQRIIELIA